ncbi:MAG: PilZ domain-containing protein [Desulfobulbaceae bacterium]|nr:PilZ domain-containing protein [Desulfobulbaceae bacterium]HIJ79166.1 PilZ domain-containing protein [Deltaproteobacteria bacterium]
MVADGSDKRKYDRIYFSLADGVNGVFVFPDLGQGSFCAAILNLSLGGIQFSIKRDQLPSSLAEGSCLILTRLTGVDGLLCDAAIPLKIRWMLDHPELSNISFGCMFEEMSADSYQQLSSLMDKKQ